jgi:hypothetical protein
MNDFHLIFNNSRSAEGHSPRFFSQLNIAILRRNNINISPRFWENHFPQANTEQDSGFRIQDSGFRIVCALRRIFQSACLLKTSAGQRFRSRVSFSL